MAFWRNVVPAWLTWAHVSKAPSGRSSNVGALLLQEKKNGLKVDKRKEEERRRGGGEKSMSRENKLIKTMALNKTKHLPLIIEEARQRAACTVGISFVWRMEGAKGSEAGMKGIISPCL